MCEIIATKYTVVPMEGNLILTMGYDTNRVIGWWRMAVSDQETFHKESDKSVIKKFTFFEINF